MSGRRLDCIFGAYQTSLKGEDGLRAERVVIGTESITVGLIADGHGGRNAAALVIDELIGMVIEEARNDASSTSLHRAASVAFAALHARLHDKAANTTAGTTATLVLINEARGECTCASVGDSFAVLYADEEVRAQGSSNSQAGKYVPIMYRLSSNDRLHDNEAEQARVIAAGGKVKQAHNREGIPGGPLRAWPGGVACAKAIGDSDVPCICAIPFVTTMAFPEPSGVVVLASDGVWDALSEEAARQPVVGADSPTHAAELLVKQAIKARGLRDDTTCLVIVGGVAASDGSVAATDGSTNSSPAAGPVENLRRRTKEALELAASDNSGDSSGESLCISGDSPTTSGSASLTHRAASPWEGLASPSSSEISPSYGPRTSLFNNRDFSPLASPSSPSSSPRAQRPPRRASKERSSHRFPIGMSLLRFMPGAGSTRASPLLRDSSVKGGRLFSAFAAQQQAQQQARSLDGQERDASPALLRRPSATLPAALQPSPMGKRSLSLPASMDALQVLNADDMTT